MLQLYGLDHIKLDGLVNYKDLKIEKEINVEVTLSFSYPNLDLKYNLIQEECYIRTKENEYIVKELNVSDDWTTYVCKINLETIKGNFVSHFEAIEQPCIASVNLALVGSGWTVGTCDVVKLRTTRKNNVSSYVVLQEIQSTYDCEMSFDSINKKVYIYQSIGSDKGTYFSEQLNLKTLNVQRNSHDYITRLIPNGKDGLGIASVNGGLTYIENNQYSNKIITAFWEDNRYTDTQSLMIDGITRLNYLSKPYKSYKAEIIDLASINPLYTILDYKLGDTITLLSKSKSTKEKQRIIKLTEYPDEPEKNSCEIANKILKLEDLQIKFIESTNTVDAVTTSDGYLDGTKIDAVDGGIIKNLHVLTADIQDLYVVTARIGTLEVNSATITQLNATNANVDNLNATKATIVDLTATNLRATTLEAQTASINTLLAGNLTAVNLAAGAIQAGSAVIANGAIGNLQILSVSAGKLTAGTIDTALITIQGANGRLKISGNRLQVFAAKADSSLYERVSIGDVNGDGSILGFLVRGADGTTIVMDQTGVYRAGITDGSINNAKIGTDAAISGTKLDIASVVVAVNGGVTTILGSKVFLNNSTLDVQFSSLTTTVTNQGNSISDHSTSITSMNNAINLKASSLELTNTNLTVVAAQAKADLGVLNAATAQTKADLGVTNAATAQTQANTGVSNAATAQTQANLGVTNAGIAKTQADLGVTNASTALGQANTATTNAATAQTQANTATTNAATALGQANTATTNAATAKTQADLGVTNAATAKTQADLGVTNAGIAQTQANLGVTNASTALTAANNAQTTANTAKTYTDNLALDSVITPDEKPDLKQAWSLIVQDGTLTTGKITAQAITFGVAHSVYDTAYSALNTYLTTTLSVFSSMTTATTGIVRTTWDSKWTDYYNARTDILNAIATKSKSLADIAQTQANAGVTNAATAQTQANAGVNNAATAQTAANTGVTNAATAQAKADLGVSNAATAQTQANAGVNNAATAQTRADLGVTNAATAKTQADLGVTNAGNAQTRADLGVTNAGNAQTQANLGVTNAGIAQTQANLGVTNAATAQTAANTANTAVGVIQTRVTATEASITVLNGSIVSKVTQTDVDNTVNAIQIGGRNLVLKSGNGYISQFGAWDTSTIRNIPATVDTRNIAAILLSARANGAANAIYQGINNFIIGQNYTFSLYVRIDPASALTLAYINLYMNAYVSVPVTKNWSRVSITQIASSVSQTCHITQSTLVDIQIEQIKIELGKFATDWTPAPEDVQSQIDSATSRLSTAETAISQNSTNINLSVSNLSTNLTNNYSTTSAMNSAINLSKDAINLSVSQNYATTGNLTTTNGNVATAQTAANNAQTQANLGVSNASTAQTQANAGVNNAATAQTQANLGVTNAGNAQGTANTANGTANTLRDTTVPALASRMSAAEIKITPSAIISTVSGTYMTPTQVGASIDGIQIGGRNLIPNSNNIVEYANDVGYGTLTRMTNETVPYWRINSSASQFVYTYDGIVFNLPLVVGKQYTISNEIRIPINGTVGLYGSIAMTSGIIANVWTKISYTFIYSAGLRVAGHTSTSTQLDTRNWKLELGNKATDWSPAVEDFGSMITQNATSVQVAFNAINSAKVTIDTAGLHVTGGSITADTIQGGTLTLGGSVNSSILMKDSSNTVIGTWNNTGLNLNAGYFSVGYTNGTNELFKTSVGGTGVVVNSNGIFTRLGNGFYTAYGGKEISISAGPDQCYLNSIGNVYWQLNSSTLRISSTTQVDGLLLANAGVDIAGGNGGLYPGTGDGAGWGTYNVKISSWYGVGFYSTQTGQCKIVMDLRSGLISTQGGYAGISNRPGFQWSGSVALNGELILTHNLGHAPIIAWYGTLGNIILTHVNVDGNRVKINTYSSGGGIFSGTVYMW